MPQSVDPTTQKVHTPPRILVSRIPDYLIPKGILYLPGSQDQSPPCHCKIPLTIPAVEMEDYVADLQVRWFLDYDPSVPASTRPVSDVRLQGGLELGTVRTGPEFDVDADALSLSQDVHVVDVVIVEQGGFEDASATQPNRAVKSAQGYEAASYRFVIDVRRTNLPAKCPDKLPSVRTCP